tara:strand:+ start:159 stop:458 length:300 start_codon:yes stop_codon:yes gene_type:complete
MLGNSASMELPKEPIVTVHATENRGHSPEEVAERCLDKIIQVSETAPSPIREQAYAFRDVLRPLLVFYMREAINSDRTTVYNILCKNGHKDVAEQIRRL